MRPGFLLLLFLAPQAFGDARYHFGLEVGAVGASLTTGVPHRPHAGGAGILLGFTIGFPLSDRVALHYLNRLPLYVFADGMPGLGVALDSFDFNAAVVKVAIDDDLSFDFMVPFFGNRAFGGGGDLRVARIIRDAQRRPMLSASLFVHPSALAYTEKHGYFRFVKVVVVAGVTVEFLWL